MQCNRCKDLENHVHPGDILLVDGLEVKALSSPQVGTRFERALTTHHFVSVTPELEFDGNRVSLCHAKRVIG